MSKSNSLRSIAACARADREAPAVAAVVRPRAAALAILLALVAAGPAAAQDDVSPPQLVDRTEPDAPRTRFGAPLEGWVKVRYSVLANGTTADIRVVEAMPPQLDSRAAAAVVKEWRFSPATVGGQAVDWHNNESTIVFDAENIPLEPSPMFAAAYVEIAELMSAEEYDKAKKQNDALLERQTVRLSEIGLVQAQAAMLHLATSNMHDAYDAIRRATDPEVTTLDAAQLADALQYRFAIEVELGRYQSSLETFDRLDALAELPDDNAVKVNANRVREALQTGAAIPVKGRVAREPWSYAPSRRTFGFSGVDGTIRGVELECDRRKTQLEYAADVEWSIPESWGECMLFVDARRDTTFTIIEFATAAAEQ